MKFGPHDEANSLIRLINERPFSLTLDSASQK